jgi:hypothetical protein
MFSLAINNGTPDVKYVTIGRTAPHPLYYMNRWTGRPIINWMRVKGVGWVRTPEWGGYQEEGWAKKWIEREVK